MASAKVRVPCCDARGRLAPRRRRLDLYSNRTDFIRTAIRNQLATHAEAVRQTLVMGVQHFSRWDLEAVRDAGECHR
jgi:Arc/MetJ-type ribon-helix-helix transcriptional regulator